MRSALIILSCFVFLLFFLMECVHPRPSRVYGGEYQKRGTGERTRTIVVHTRVIGIVRISRAGEREDSTYGEPFIPRNIFTSPARRCTSVHGAPASLKFNDGAENIHSRPRAPGNKWLTLATSERRRGKKGTEFKHIRERWCLKNNHGARKRERGEGEQGGRERCSRERRGLGVDDWGNKFFPSLPMVVGIGLAVTTLVLQQQQQQPRRSCDIEPRINYPHAKTYYRAIDKTDAPQLGLARVTSGSAWRIGCARNSISLLVCELRIDRNWIVTGRRSVARFN